MGYFDAADLPFTYALAKTFPINDRYFSSVMAQTFPNRRFLISGTALGIVDDSLPSALPPRGVIFQELSKHGISWRDYHASFPTLGHVPPSGPGPVAALESGEGRPVLHRRPPREPSRQSR